jgi:general secretion pathway protein D
VPSGRTAIIGGLMEGQLRWLALRPADPVAHSGARRCGELPQRHHVKRELIIFLRPIVIRDASLEGDLAAYRRYLPDHEFFRDTQSPLPGLEQNLQRLERGEFPDLRGTPNRWSRSPPAGVRP